MHIAICDDNIADRKQLERLLGRESDKRKSDTGVFYTDSYGDSEVLGKNPMPYDLFFIDMTAGEANGLDFALELRKFGVTVPIILCSSKIDYQAAIAALPECSYEFMHLSKPIITAELSAILDQSIALLSNRVSTIELRSDTETYYVQEDDIVCAVTEGQYVRVTLKDGQSVLLLTKLLNFYDTVCMYSHMVLLTDKTLCNIIYLDSFSPFKVTLKNGTALKSSPFSVKYIKLAQQMYQDEAKEK